MKAINYEEIFDNKMREIASQLAPFTNYDLVIGIPFIDEGQQLAELLLSVDQVLKTWMGRRQLIVCVGDHSAVETSAIISELQITHPLIQFLLPGEISGRGMSVRAIFEISQQIDADLLLFSAKMASEKGPGIEFAWLDSLLTPIQGDYDLVLGSMRRHMAIDSISHMFAIPILEVFYGFRGGDPLGGIYAISHDLTEELAHEARFWSKIIRGAGIDFWLLTRALIWNKRICEVNMPGRVTLHSLEARNKIFADHALVVFEALKRDSATWLQERLLIKVADILVRSEIIKPDTISYSLNGLIDSYHHGYLNYAPIFENFDHKIELDKLVQTQPDQFKMDDQLWLSALLYLLQQYAFADEDERDVSNFAALTSLYNARIASYVLEMKSFHEKLNFENQDEIDEMMVKKMDAIRQRLTNELWQMKPKFTQMWIEKTTQSKPPLIPLGYMEYVPGKPVVVPKKIIGKDERIVETDRIFRELRRRYEDKFNNFIYDELKVPVNADDETIIDAVRGLMTTIESTLDKLLPGDLHDQDGLQSFVQNLFGLFPQHKMYTIKEELIRETLVRFPPINLMIFKGYHKPSQFVEEMDPRDAVTYANLGEEWNYGDRDVAWLLESLKPKSFEWVDVKPIIVSGGSPFGMIYAGKVSMFNPLTARIVIKPLETGEGGKFPKIRYFTNLVRRLAMVDNYSEQFQLINQQHKDIGLKMRNMILGLGQGEQFSAYNIYENHHHRILVRKIRDIAHQQNLAGHSELANLFYLMAKGYGVGQVLENEVFLTCNAWSWASYSFKGGKHIPVPISTSVESRWFNHDFLELLYEELGYDRNEIMQIVYRLYQTGKSEQNLLDTLLPARPKDVPVIVQETTSEPSKQLLRYKKNPILEPIKTNKWETKYVLNPGALRIEDKVYLFYRAVGDDNVSVIGLAVTDGYKVLERLSEPVFSPAIPEERMGCEDPRLTIIDDRIYMLYTAYDGNIAQIAAASTGVKDIKAGRYFNWQREGLAFKNIWDKDAILFPEKVNGRYVVYHRIEPSIWVTYTKEIKFPLTENHAIIVGPRPGRMWDSLKIGAGAQPLKTRYGWLLIYHGVDYNYVYRLGVLLVDLLDPQKVIYRSPNPILEPEEDFEIGLDGAWVPNVVFTCGAVAGSDKDILDDEDEILVYYGAADTSIGVATGKLKDLIPASFRQ